MIDVIANVQAGPREEQLAWSPAELDPPVRGLRLDDPLDLRVQRAVGEQARQVITRAGTIDGGKSAPKQNASIRLDRRCVNRAIHRGREGRIQSAGGPALEVAASKLKQPKAIARSKESWSWFPFMMQC